MNSIVELAIQVSRDTGFPVFPCNNNPENKSEDKKPLTPHGFKDASSDPSIIRKMFDTAECRMLASGLHNGPLIGIPTGLITDMAVIDVDLNDDPPGTHWLDDHAVNLPLTPQNKTRGGGFHLRYRMPIGPLGNSARKLAPGVDIRAEGGYVIWWPAHGLPCKEWDGPQPFPEWIYELLTARPEPPCQPPRAAPSGGDRDRLWAQAALEEECAGVAGAREGQRNQALNRAAFKLGQLVGAQLLAETEAIQELYYAALGCGLPAAEADKTIRSGMSSGMRSPRGRSEDPPEPRGLNGHHYTGKATEEPGRPSEARELTVSVGGWDEAKIPHRPWVAKNYLLRGSVSMIAGMGAAGKSMLCLGYCISLITGKSFGRFKPVSPMRVVAYNCEDDKEEQERRISAVLRQYGMKSNDKVLDNLMRITPNEDGALLDYDQKSRKVYPTKAMYELEIYIREHRPDGIILDPMVEVHKAGENDNSAQRAVVAFFRSLAKQFSIFILLIHHTRKGNQNPGDAEIIRGGGAIVGAVRVALTAVGMDVNEAQELGIEEHHRCNFFRIDNAKANYHSSKDADWYERIDHLLDNGEVVSACHPWQLPEACAPNQAIMLSLIEDIAKGCNCEPWSPKLDLNERSIRQLLHRYNVNGIKSEKMTIDLLSKYGVKICEYRRPMNRIKALGYKTSNGLPNVKWE